MPKIISIPGTSPFTLRFIVRPGAAPADGGDVLLFVSPEQSVRVEVNARLFRTMRVLINAWAYDTETGLDDQPGLRSRHAMARDYADLNAVSATPFEDTMTAYVQLFRRQLRKALAKAARMPGVEIPDDLPDVIVGLRGRGYRIGDFGVEVYDYSRGHGSGHGGGFHYALSALASW